MAVKNLIDPKEKRTRLIVSVTPEQEKILLDAGIIVFDRDEDVIWDSIVTRDRISNITEGMLDYGINEGLFKKKHVADCARRILDDEKLFDTYVDKLFKDFKELYTTELGVSYADADDFVLVHVKKYIEKNPNLFKKTSNKKESPVK